VSFEVMDAQGSIPVRYQGILPDLFREGQGVVTEGVLEPSGAFRADTVLAKHDETYMPREVADALREQGHWQGEGNSPPKQ
jgi:cytochrome c-type biogenesis protein CcmE